MVHLTRDDEDEWSPGSGGDARQNFQSILRDKRILAIKPHCLYGELIKKLRKNARAKFNVACFTETPLAQIKHLLAVPRRQIELEPYGFVFERDFLYQQHAQPALYFSEYNDNKSSRNAFDRIYEVSARKNFAGKMWRILPFVNVMHDRHDFAWEREWRVAGELRFDLDDLVCVILPEHDRNLRKQMATKGIATIDPDWGYDQVVAELVSVAKTTAFLAVVA